MDEEVIPHKSENKKHKRSKEKEALSSSEVPAEKKKKHKRRREKEALSSSEVPTEKKHKRNKEIETLSTSEVPTEKKKHKKSKEQEIPSTSEEPTEKQKHRKSKEKEALSSSEVPIDVGGEKKVKGSRDKKGFPDNGREESGKRKKKKDKEKVTECSDIECATDQAASKGKDRIDVGGEENYENGKGKKTKRENANGGDSGESCIEKSGGEAESGSRSSKKRNREEEVLDVVIGEDKKKKKKKKKKKTKMDANVENTKANVGDVETENNFGSTNEQLRNSDAKKSSKRVKFASHVEVFPLSDDQDDWEENPGNKLVQGKWFTGKEDQIIKDAVDKYIEAHKLGVEGLDMVLHCQKYTNVRNCWKEI
ncbi:hypothetical protein MKW92_007103, partial [Papaver armeniacum]